MGLNGGFQGCTVHASKELREVMDDWKTPWCSSGDFNVVRFPSDRLGASKFSLQMRLFNAFS